MDAGKSNANSMREENQELEAIARVSRSLVHFEKSLKVHCMESIFENAVQLLQAPSESSQFDHLLPPVVRQEFLEKLLEWADEEEEGCWTDEELERVFSLVQLLLDESVTEFDFRVYRKRLGRDQETWRLLLERCPNLTGVSDPRERGDAERRIRNVELDVLPNLLRLKKLETIRIASLELGSQDVPRLVQTFPDLRSFAFIIDFKQIHLDLLNELFKWKKLMFLEIELTGFAEQEEGIAQYLTNELTYECVRHLPCVQDAIVHSGNYSMNINHNSKHEVLNSPLALKTLYVRESFKGWSSDMLPDVTNLHITGPLRHANEFLGFGNLKVLTLTEVAFADVRKFLRVGKRLRELDITTEDSIGAIDLFEVFHFCPDLEIVFVSSNIARGRPEVFPVAPENFKNLQKATIYLDNLAATENVHFVVQQILMAPRLEELEIHSFPLSLERTQELLELLRQRKVLQRLIRIDLDVHHGVSFQVKQLIVRFLKLLLCYAPRLKRITLRDAHNDAELRWLHRESQVAALAIPDGSNFVFNLYEQ